LRRGELEGISLVVAEMGAYVVLLSRLQAALVAADFLEDFMLE